MVNMYTYSTYMHTQTYIHVRVYTLCMYAQSYLHHVQGEFIQMYEAGGYRYGLTMAAVEQVAQQGLACVTHMTLQVHMYTLTCRLTLYNTYQQRLCVKNTDIYIYIYIQLPFFTTHAN